VKQIKEGFKDSTGKERMKAFADKFTDDEVKGLVAYVARSSINANSLQTRGPKMACFCCGPRHSEQGPSLTLPRA